MFSFFSKYIFYFLRLDFSFSFRTYAGRVLRTCVDLSRNVLCLIAERSLPYRGTFFTFSRNVLYLLAERSLPSRGTFFTFSRNVLYLLAERSLLSISLNIRTKEYNLYGLLHHASRIYTVCCTILAESIRFVAPS